MAGIGSILFGLAPTLALASTGRLLVGLGVLIRRYGFLRPTTIDDLRAMVLNITLPAALFLAIVVVESAILAVRYDSPAVALTAVLGGLASGRADGGVVGIVIAVSPWQMIHWGEHSHSVAISDMLRI